MDGVDLSPILFGDGKSKRDVHFYYLGDQPFAVRKGAFKAHFITYRILHRRKSRKKHNPPLLFNLSTDPSERFEISAEHPDVVAELTKIYETHRTTVTRGKLQF